MSPQPQWPNWLASLEFRKEKESKMRNETQQSRPGQKERTTCLYNNRITTGERRKNGRNCSRLSSTGSTVTFLRELTVNVRKRGHMLAICSDAERALRNGICNGGAPRETHAAAADTCVCIRRGYLNHNLGACHKGKVRRQLPCVARRQRQRAWHEAGREMRTIAPDSKRCG